MRRLVSAIMLIVFAFSNAGCDGDSTNDTPESPTTAKAAAAKMPPPPGNKAPAVPKG